MTFKVKGGNMSNKMEFYRKLIASIPDGRGFKVRVYKSGRSIQLRFSHPDNGNAMSIDVHTLHRDTPDGWIHEINNQCFPSISVVNGEMMINIFNNKYIDI